MKYFCARRGLFMVMSFLFLTTIAGIAETRAVTLYSVSTGNQLVRFDSAAPASATTVGAITGLQPGENVLAIDFRPATGQLYALGSTSRLYVINRSSAAAAAVGTLSVALSGTDFGFDFNPTVDRIRIVSNTGQNLRVNPNDGSVTNDGAINPIATGITSAAYTNDFNGATSTTLFTIDSTLNVLNTQNPPNNGTQIPVGPLGIAPATTNGFDISSADGRAYASFTVGASTGLYTVNTTTGAATLVGPIGSGTTASRGLAAEVGSSNSNVLVFGVTTANQLVKFNSARPNTILNTLSIAGLQSGENILGIDFRPATGQLFGLGSTSRLYTIDTVTGSATQVGSAGAFTLSGTDFGFDFNPVPDRIRVVSNTGQNIRLNPNDGTLAATDTALNPGAPSVTAAAYTNSVAGATTTTLFTIDTAADTINLQGGLNGTPSPNTGTQTAAFTLGFDANGTGGFDISPSGVSLAALQLPGDAASKLFTINIFSGGATFLGPIGVATPLRGLAIAPGTAASNTVDFDGDRKTDYSVFRPASNGWFVNRSSNNTVAATGFGLAESDTLTPADYDGDGKTDIAVWRASTGYFYVLRSSDSSVQFFQFGQNGDEPIARDYDGDTKADFAVVRRQGGSLVWYINNSATSTVRIEQFGIAADFTAPGDYDGDGRFDLGVKRGIGSDPATYYVQRSRDGFLAQPFGYGSDLAVPGDYDGDGRTDITALRQGTDYTWYTLLSSNGFIAPVLGTKPQYATQGDYDGDGRTDIAIWDPASGNYTIKRSSNGATTTFQFGQNGDVPVASFDTH